MSVNVLRLDSQTLSAVSKPARGGWPSAATGTRTFVRSEQASDCHAVPEKVAFKLMIWAWKLTGEQRGGLTSRQFVRYGLLRLRLGDDLTHITTGKATRRPIAPAEEVGPGLSRACPSAGDGTHPSRAPAGEHTL